MIVTMIDTHLLKRHFPALFLFVITSVIFAGCNACTEVDNTPTQEDTLRYARIEKYVADDDLPNVTAELEAFLATTRPHTSRMDMKVIDRLAWYRICGKRQQEGMMLVLKGDSIAHVMEDEMMQAVFQYANGRYLVNDNMEEAQRNMKEGADRIKEYFESTTDIEEKKYCAGKLISYYSNILLYMPDEQVQERHERLEQLEQLMVQFKKEELIPQSRLNTDFLNFYQLKVNLLMDEGKEAEAEEACQKAAQIECSNTWYKERAIETMLMELGKYDEVIDKLEKRQQVYLSIGDTLELNENYCSLLGSMATCYEKLGMKEQADAYKKEHTRVEEAITLHHANQKVERLSAEYEIQQKQYQIHEERMRRHRTLTIALVTTILLFIAMAGYVYYRRTTHIMKKKNKALSAHLDQILDEKKRLKEKQESVAKKYSDKGTETPSENMKEMDADSIRTVELFINELTSRKLYCNMNFDRDALLDELHIPRRPFPQKFETCTGTSISQFIQSLRLEYAADMIRNNKDYTIDAISLESGFSSRATFYRNFTKQFGITPTEYRAQCFEK